jgi:small GTP-binding protein
LKQQILLLSSEAGRIHLELGIVKSGVVSEFEAIRNELLSHIDHFGAACLGDRIDLSREKVRLLLLGDSGVGKTVLFNYWCRGTPEESPLNAAVGVDFFERTVMVKGSAMKLTLWDSSGRKKFRDITASYARNLDGIVLVYNITRRSSFEDIPEWLELARANAKSCRPPVQIVAWKNTAGFWSAREPEVSAEGGRALAKRDGVIDMEFGKFMESVSIN